MYILEYTQLSLDWFVILFLVEMLEACDFIVDLSGGGHSWTQNIQLQITFI